MSELFHYTYKDLIHTAHKAVQILGGSGSRDEIEEAVIQILDLSDEKVNELSDRNNNLTKLNYHLSIAKVKLQEAGYLKQSESGVWSLTNEGSNTLDLSEDEVNSIISASNIDLADIEINLSSGNESENWKKEVLNILKNLSPSKFERLCQRLLRELGFSNVEVTGKTGDGGIDGKGTFKLGEILSFHIAFQCKRYNGAVSTEKIRDFRGAIMGKADKGLFITTGYYTREAKKEAYRDGGLQIDIIDGYELVELLKKKKLGISVEMVESISINNDWFHNF